MANETRRGGFAVHRHLALPVRYRHARLRVAALRMARLYRGAQLRAQLRDGRILLPFSYSIPARWNNRGQALADFSYRGYYRSTVLFSDDQGATWNTGPQSLPVPVPDVSYAYGAVEPVAVELGDGRVWMLIRTQMGRFYEAFSRDGLRWSDPRPTRLLSSDSPAGLVRLADGRLVLLWNNCLRFPAGCRRTRGRGHTASRVPGSQLPAPALPWRAGRCRGVPDRTVPRIRCLT